MLPRRHTNPSRRGDSADQSRVSHSVARSYGTARPRHGLCTTHGVSVGRIHSGQLHSGYAVTPPPPSCRLVPRATLCDPTEPIAFGDFLESRNRVARAEQADRGRLLGNLHRPAAPRPRRADASLNLPTLLPRLGEVLPVQPMPKAQQIVRTQVLERSVRTGSLIDVVI